jgi:CubicO group peptidase (beta-lactamase class C family)
MIIQSKKSANMSVNLILICRKCIFLFALLLIQQICWGQQGFKPVHQWLKNNLYEMGGRAVLVIYKDGQIIYQQVENKLHRRQRIANRIINKKLNAQNTEIEDFSLQSKQPIASCSKWLSAALVMTFVDEGKLSLEDSVGKYLPYMTSFGKGGIKIWHCLAHLTGIKTGSLKETIKLTSTASSMDDAIKSFAALPFEGTPGKTFHYSNAGLQIAAAVIEKISGKDFKTLFQERIAKPCAMNQTDFGTAKIPLPAGGANSTPEDYMHFLSMLLNKGIYNGKQVLSEQAINVMQLNRISADAKIINTPEEAGNFTYGSGLWVMDGKTYLEKSNEVSSPGLFGSFPWINNHLNYAGFLFTFNLKTKGRHERYVELMQIVNHAIQQK